MNERNFQSPPYWQEQQMYGNNPKSYFNYDYDEEDFREDYSQYYNPNQTDVYTQSPDIRFSKMDGGQSTIPGGMYDPSSMYTQPSVTQMHGPSMGEYPGMMHSPSMGGYPGMMQTPSMGGYPGMMHAPSMGGFPGMMQTPSMGGFPGMMQTPSMGGFPGMMQTPSTSGFPGMMPQTAQGFPPNF